MNKLTLHIFILFTIPLIACAESSEDFKLKYSISAEWGEPVIKIVDKATSPVKMQLTYTRPEATLIMTQSPCANCKSLGKKSVDELNSHATLGISAMLISVQNIPAIYQVASHPKGIDIRLVKFIRDGAGYEIQLGVNKTASVQKAFELEKEFIKLMDSINLH